MQSTHYPRDVRFFLLLIPAINVINYYLTYPQIKFDFFFALTFTIDTMQGYAAWAGIRGVIVWLDQKMPYGGRFISRVLLQILLTNVVGLLIIVALTELVNFLARSEPVPLVFYTRNLFIFAIWILVINGIYIAWYLFRSWQEAIQAQSNGEEISEDKSIGIFVKSGKQNLLIPFSTVLCIWVDGHYTLLYVQELRKYFVDMSLDKVAEQLPTNDFFRVNRQWIIHRQAILGYRRLENGKLQILVKPLSDLPAELTMSRTKAPEFKRWFKV